MNVLFFQHLESGAVSRTLTSYPDEPKALIGLYGGMRASINDTNIVKVIGELIDDDGHVSKCERYSRVVVRIPEESEGNE